MIKKDKLIILDFDHVVFNTTLYVKALQKVFKDKFDIDKAEFIKQRDAIKYCCVVIDIDRFVHSFPGQDFDKMHNTIHELIKTQAYKFVFLDVLDFMERYKSNFDIIIETHGDKELQTEKIEHSNLPKYIKHSISLESKEKVIGDYVANYKQIYFFDDKIENIDKVKTAHPSIITYFVKRPEDSPYGDKASKCDCADYIIKGLNIDIN